MKTSYSYFSKAEIVISKEVINHIIRLVKSIKIKVVPHSASQINGAIINKVHQFGWSEEVRLVPYSNITITSVKDKIGMCVQTGNISRIYADLIKLQTLFSRCAIESAIVILAENAAAKKLGQNIANYQRLVRELPIFKDVITVPLLVIGFDDDVEE
jgi:hypothetical protein